MNIEQKIFHYKQTKWNIPFRELHHTVVTVCELVKPIYPNTKPLKYFEYFFTEIDFDKIDSNPSKAETLKYCNAIYYGLEQILKADISKAILDYQNNIHTLSKEQIKTTQIQLIKLTGLLRRAARNTEAGISFTKRYISLIPRIREREQLYNIDYQLLISSFGETMQNDLLSSIEIISETLKEIVPLLPSTPPQQTEKPKPELNEALISFSSTEIIESLHNELKGYFQGKEAELKRALQGKQLQEFMLFPHNQNKFVEVFKRLKYNGFLLSTPKETKDWICSTFTYQYQKGNKKEVREFNTSTVHDILTKDKGEPTKNERICIVDWLPYKSHLTRQREAEKESI